MMISGTALWAVRAAILITSVAGSGTAIGGSEVDRHQLDGPPGTPARTQPREFPRLTIEDFHYVGAFRLPARQYGVSSVN